MLSDVQVCDFVQERHSLTRKRSEVQILSRHLHFIASDSVGEQRHRHAVIAAEEHRSGDGGRPEPVSHDVERCVDGV